MPEKYEAIDFENLKDKEKQRKILAQYITNYPNKKFFQKGDYDFTHEEQDLSFNLPYDILVRKRRNDKGITGSRYEVMNPYPILHSAEIIPCTAYKIEDGEFKLANNNKERLTKFMFFKSALQEEQYSMEYKTGALQKHAHVKPAVAVCIDGQNAVAVTMRHLGNTNLRDFLKENAAQLTTKQYLLIALAVSKACREQLRDLGIFHGDLKPENLMINETNHSDEPYIIYTIDRQFSGFKETMITSFGGTEGYESPETQEARIINEKTELFSVGVTLWDIFYSDENKTKKCNGKNIASLIERLLSNEPEDRPDYEAIDEILKTELQAITQAETKKSQSQIFIDHPDSGEEMDYEMDYEMDDRMEIEFLGKRLSRASC